MVKKIIVSHFNNIAAIVQNNKIQEIIIVNNKYQVNDIYLGIVQKIFSSINAAFVKLGKYGKSGFIHINDIKPLKKQSNINNISETLAINQLILVQVIKEPTLNKGPRLTANINLSGKYIILMPFCKTICISHKIYDENERTYLYSLALLIKPMNMGLLIKSSAQGIEEHSLLEDLNSLKKQWYFIQKIASIVNRPTLIYKDEDLIQRIVKEFCDHDIKKIIIDSEYGLNQLYYHLNKYNNLNTYINKTKLQLYNKSECILEKFKIQQSILKALKPKVNLESGGHIIIESKEALTVIDVNSGSFNTPNNSKDTILRTNLYAAFEIAHQLKIRNINGVIIIDFIDMRSQKDQLQLLEYFSQLLKLDNAKPKIVQLSELGLLELTRRRRGQSLYELFKYEYNEYSHSSLKLKLLDMIKKSHQTKKNLFHKNIKTLFFNKKFRKNIELEIKQFEPKKSLKCKYFTYFDRKSTINLMKPKANFIVPMLFYYNFIGDQ